MKRLELTFHQQKVKQGDIVEANYKVDELGSELSKLEGKSFNDILYIHKFSENGVQVVFVQTPQADFVAQDGVTISWNPIQVEETQAAEKLIFGKFEVPARSQVLVWGPVGLAVLLALGLIGRKLYLRAKIKNEVLLKKRRAKSDLLDATDYETVVEIWKKKNHYFDIFPHVKEPFEKFETVLNKYQFKPMRSQAELVEIMQAWREFKSAVEGGFYGV